MKKIRNFLIAAMLSISIISMPAAAAATSTTVNQPASSPVSTKPGMIVTAFGGSDLLDFVELYNQTSEPIKLTGSQIQFTVHDTSNSCGDHIYSVDAPEGWLLPKSYFTLERGNQSSDPAEAYYTVPADFLGGCIAPVLTKVNVIGKDGATFQNISLEPGILTADNWAQHKQRGKSSLGITGVFTDDYSLQASDSAALYSSPLYEPPIDTAGLKILEILPHAFSCPPTDDSLLCSGYVKLFNLSATPINLSDYRLRTSYGGLKSSSSNTVNLNGVLLPGQYQLVNSRDDGSPLGLTQSGGYVWLEDAQGTQVYQPVVTYPDASTDSKVGQAWAFDGANWQWTTSPQPTGSNIFTLEVLSKSHRQTKSSLKPCAPNQARNPITNRCRKIGASTKTLTACKPGQERNLSTGRCRSVLAATESKKPCKPGQERNPDTGRCRKIQPKMTNVKDIKTAEKSSNSHWYAVAAVAATTTIYVIYEWKQELTDQIERLKFKLRRLFRFPGRQKEGNLIK